MLSMLEVKTVKHFFGDFSRKQNPAPFFGARLRYVKSYKKCPTLAAIGLSRQAMDELGAKAKLYSAVY
jgi:hypothetical protein